MRAFEPLPDGGVAEASAVTSRLLEAERRAEDAERRVAELTSRMQALGEAFASAERRLLERDRIVATCAMFASIAHDIRSPLTALVCNLRIIEERLAPAERAELADLFEDNRLACEVIDALLARMKAHANSYGSAEKVRLRPLADAVVRLSRWHMSRRSVRFESHLEGDLHVWASAGEVCQILLNLLANAADASPRGGTVWLTAEQRGGIAAILVRDQGEGIDEEEAELIFLPLYTRKRDGLGVGLAMARAMARRHGGELQLARQPGPGACFELLLPVAP